LSFSPLCISGAFQQGKVGFQELHLHSADAGQPSASSRTASVALKALIRFHS
jgi:hypothetical protein